MSTKKIGETLIFKKVFVNIKGRMRENKFRLELTLFHRMSTMACI